MRISCFPNPKSFEKFISFEDKDLQDKHISNESINADTTENLYIEGDNLEVLKLLRQNYYSAIKMIYIDPPYNTGNDFVYNDNFKMGEIESELSEGNVDELNGTYNFVFKKTRLATWKVVAYR